jgi:tetratricopeptide (TPR) repeat protein
MPGAIQAYEQGIKFMYAENYEKAIKIFTELIAEYPDEAEIQAGAKARIQACVKRLEQNARTIYRSADDHYNVGVALMNRGEIDEALNHFQSALKMAPKSDHILYALAATNALKGNSAQAITYLKQSIQYRNENRFQAASDTDFAVLAEDPAFKDLLNTPGK